MATFGNRFAMLSMDDDSSDESHPKVEMVEQAQIAVPLAVPSTGFSKREPTRKWTLDEGKPENAREWNFERTGANRKHGPFSRYSFQDEDRPKNPHMRTYAFRDESPPPQDVKRNTTPINAYTPPYPPGSPVPLPSIPGPQVEDFPKLSNFERPRSPPYPPDDGWYPTLAERIRVAMEKKEHEVKKEKKTISMDTVIPMSSVLMNKMTLN